MQEKSIILARLRDLKRFASLGKVVPHYNDRGQRSGALYSAQQIQDITDLIEDQAVKLERAEKMFILLKECFVAESMSIADRLEDRQAYINALRTL